VGLEGDLNQLAADDRLGRKLQDLALEPKSRRLRITRRATTTSDAPT